MQARIRARVRAPPSCILKGITCVGQRNDQSCSRRRRSSLLHYIGRKIYRDWCPAMSNTISQIVEIGKDLYARFVFMTGEKHQRRANWARPIVPTGRRGGSPLGVGLRLKEGRLR